VVYRPDTPYYNNNYDIIITRAARSSLGVCGFGVHFCLLLAWVLWTGYGHSCCKVWLHLARFSTTNIQLHVLCSVLKVQGSGVLKLKHCCNVVSPADNGTLFPFLIFRMRLASVKWSPKRRVAYIHVGERSELGWL
jgi:hypothetical protein